MSRSLAILFHKVCRDTKDGTELYSFEAGIRKEWLGMRRNMYAALSALSECRKKPFTDNFLRCVYDAFTKLIKK